MTRFLPDHRISNGAMGRDPVVDRRAERIRAEADAEQARAGADAIRAQTAAQVWQAQAEHARRQAAAEREARQIRRADRTAATTARRARVRAAVAGVTGGLPALAGVVACVAPTLIATRGQYEFGVEQMRLGPVGAVLVPLMLEGAAWLLAWRRHQAIRAGESAGRLTAGVWALALTAAGLNVWHGTTGNSFEVGVMLGVASLVGFGLVELLARHDQHRHRPAARRAWTTGVARAVRFPRVAFAAWSRRIELGPGLDPQTDRAQAWTQAWTDRHGVVPGADARARRRGRREVRAEIRTGSRAARPSRPGADQLADVVSPSPVSPLFLSPPLRQIPDLGARGWDDAQGWDLDGPDQAPAPTTEQDRPDVSDLLDPGREIAAELRRADAPLTRAALTSGLRTRGYALSTDRASALLAVLHLEGGPHDPEDDLEHDDDVKEATG